MILAPEDLAAELVDDGYYDGMDEYELMAQWGLEGKGT